MKQRQSRRATQKERDEFQAAQVAAETERHVDRKIVALTDEFLDEVDDVLETNAAQFVRDYVQKGGE